MSEREFDSTAGAQGLYAELKRRNVFRVGAAYIVIGWLALQVADVVLGFTGAPPWVGKTLIALLLLGFVPALGLAWIFEVDARGLRVDDGHAGRGDAAAHASRLDIATLVAVFGVLVLMAWQHLGPGFRSGTADPAVAAPGARTVAAPADSRAPPAATADAGVSKSIAVLPFVNMSSDPEQVYFSDGIAEELLNALVKLPEIKVAGRTSSFAFRDKTGDLREIGRALNVNHILEGSVRKQGARVRITAQLVTAEDGFHLWSETYDREAGDIFALQDEITAAIVAALKVKLGSAPASSRTAIDIAAYELYLKARQQLALRGVVALQSARRLFGEVIDRAPEYAPAHAGLARAAALLWTYASSEADSDSYITRIEAQRIAGLAARRALELDPDLAEAWSVLGYVAYVLGDDLQLAEQAMTRALALLPRDPEIVNFAGDFHTWVMDARAEATERLAAELDPLQAANHYDLARVLLMKGRFNEALESVTSAKTLGFFRRSPAQLYDSVVPILVGLGRLDDAEAAIRAAQASDGLSRQMVDAMRVQVLVARGKLDAASKLVDSLLADDPATRVAETFLVDVLIRTRRYDEAASWLERSAASRNAWTADPQYMPLPESLPAHPALRAAYDRPEYRSLFEARRRNLAAAQSGGGQQASP